MSELLALLLLSLLVASSGTMLFKRKQMLPWTQEVDFLPLIIVLRVFDVLTALVFVVGTLYLMLTFILVILGWLG